MITKTTPTNFPPKSHWNPRAVERSDHNGDCKPGKGPPWLESQCKDSLALSFVITALSNNAGDEVFDWIDDIEAVSDPNGFFGINDAGNIMLLQDLEPRNTPYEFTAETATDTIEFDVFYALGG